MATMISEVYDVFRATEGVGEEKARKAAKAMAAYDNRFSGLDLKLEELKGSLRLVHWMLATLVASNVALLVRAFF